MLDYLTPEEAERVAFTSNHPQTPLFDAQAELDRLHTKIDDALTELQDCLQYQDHLQLLVQPLEQIEALLAQLHPTSEHEADVLNSYHCIKECISNLKAETTATIRDLHNAIKYLET